MSEWLEPRAQNHMIFTTCKSVRTFVILLVNMEGLFPRTMYMGSLFHHYQVDDAL
jgi:hypothetical protein